MLPTPRGSTLLALSFLWLLSAATPVRADDVDPINGAWTLTIAGRTSSALIECYDPLGREVTLRYTDGGVERVVQLARAGDLLTGGGRTRGLRGGILGGPGSGAVPAVVLRLHGRDTAAPDDDALTGKIHGAPAALRRDLRETSPIALALPGDRPWVRFEREVIAPKVTEDRERSHRFRSETAAAFLSSCDPALRVRWTRELLAGGEGNVLELVESMEGVTLSPRTFEATFEPLVAPRLARGAFVGSAVRDMRPFLLIAAGSGVRLQLGEGCVVYLTTDQVRNMGSGDLATTTPVRATARPTHGRWLHDLARMDLEDDGAFTRALLELLVKSRASSPRSARGQAAFTDYLGLMARAELGGIFFDGDDHTWGTKYTRFALVALVSRALSHGERRSSPVLVDRLGAARAEELGLDGRQEPAAQVLVGVLGGITLRPGDCTFFATESGAGDILQGERTPGEELQSEYGSEMLASMTSEWLDASSPELVAEVRASLARFLRPEDEDASYLAANSIFGLLAEALHEQRFASVTEAEGERILKATAALMKRVRQGSRELEAYLLAQGVVKSSEWAPRGPGR